MGEGAECNDYKMSSIAGYYLKEVTRNNKKEKKKEYT